MEPTVRWESIKDQVEQEISGEGVKRGEFVVSNMTKAMANAMIHAIDQTTLPDLASLDVGTGTAYHTLLQLGKGVPKINSIDINPKAIEYAKDRVQRFYPEVEITEEANFLKVDGERSEKQRVNFYNYALDKVAEQKEVNYSMVSFNPPILYPVFPTEFGKPATHGVYYENKDARNKEADLVYAFYRDIAQQNLAEGSHIMCIWANLNRHLVELDPFNAETEEYVHPAEILKNWFGFEFENEAESFNDFYCHQTILGAVFFNQSETGKLYSDNLRKGIEAGLYSKLLIPSEEENLSGTYFHFGVLHLVKTSATENKFRIVNGSSKGK